MNVAVMPASVVSTLIGSLAQQAGMLVAKNV